MLGELSGDRDAWRFVIRLWGWGLDNDRVNGILHVPAWKIAEASGYQGDPEKWVEWLKTSKLLVPKRGGLYMSGWSRMRRFFKERKRLRDYRKKKKAAEDSERKRLENAARTRTVLGNTSPSPYTDLHERDPCEGFQTLPELEKAGYPKYRGITGGSIATFRNLLPVSKDELDAAFTTNGRSWAYAATVIVDYRAKMDKGPGPPMRGLTLLDYVRRKIPHYTPGIQGSGSLSPEDADIVRSMITEYWEEYPNGTKGW